ncbi:diguanylate cyclase domain-containing protein [Gloeothece verrucosa]|uniref:Response regulator receiver modulated diguanylate cyclase n=1 Tax=Gloeothece verrucosa (strain PCC 7822) TaxID=497965 RepID=E0UGX0_GLOV7|nr:diguanylate cyclase [Gloeothece verrucosa]ADN14451.1 response regulator receiver modulated diguanylate cyclase [Gloeothece verrucosa PCC 7822]
MPIYNPSLHILLIEDNSYEAELIKDMIESVLEIPVILTHHSYLKHGIQSLQQNNYDIILLDIRLPDNQDLSSINQIKQQASTTPIVVLSNIQDKNIAVEAVRQGAQDYLYKGQFDSELLCRAIGYAIERQQIEEQLKQQKLQLQRQKEELQKQIEREQLMGRMIERIRKSLELRDILKTTVSEVRYFLNTDRVMIYCCRDGSPARIVAESLAPQQEKPVPLLARVSHLLETNLYHYSLTPEQNQEIDQILNSLINSVLTVPIWQNQPEGEASLWGQLLAQDYSGNREWQNWEIEFLTQLGNSLAIAIQQSELYQTVQNQAMLDGLTGIANRRQFDLVLRREWERLAAQENFQKIPVCMSLIMCDVDFFKNYNTFYGHLGGDDCLKQVANVIKLACERASDVAARYGGEEFAIILPDTDEQGALTVAHKIHSALKQRQIPHDNSAVSEYVTLSIGIATQIPSLDREPKFLIDLADQALQQAKAQGRNRIIQSES